MMDAEAVANRSSYWKLAAALQSFLLLLQKKRLGKENEPGGISISPRSPLNRPRKPPRFSWIFPAKFEKLLKIFGISRKSFVGVDAHIDPADCTVFTEIYGEFVTAQRADVGIGPYRTLANPYCLATFERKADLSQIF